MKSGTSDPSSLPGINKELTATIPIKPIHVIVYIVYSDTIKGRQTS